MCHAALRCGTCCQKVKKPKRDLFSEKLYKNRQGAMFIEAMQENINCFVCKEEIIFGSVNVSDMIDFHPACYDAFYSHFK